jgi:uncharacterized protein (UPF0332 family)
MNPQQYLDLAQEWLADSREAAWRSAVSRAYYATFHQARLFFLAASFRVPRESRGHPYLIYRLSNTRDEQVNLAGKDLDELRLARNRADYDFAFSLTNLSAQVSIERAIRFMSILEDLSQDGDRRTEIIQDIRDYEREVLQEVTFWG